MNFFSSKILQPISKLLQKPDSLKFLLIVFISGFVLRLTAGIYVDAVTTGAYGFRDYAVNILSGNGYLWIYDNNPNFIQNLVTFRPPLYTLFYTGMMWMFGSWSLGYIVLQSLISACVPLIIYKTTRLMFEEGASRWSACLAVIYPHFLTRSGNVSDDNLFLPLLSLILFESFKYVKYKSIKSAWLVGLYTGLAMLTRQSIALFIPLMFCFMIFLNRKLITSFIFAGTAIILTLPWILFHYMQYNTFSLSDATGRTLWVGNNALTYYSSRFPSQSIDLIEKELMRSLEPRTIDSLKTLNTVQQDKYFGELATRFIIQNPIDFIASIFWKNRGLIDITYSPWNEPQYRRINDSFASKRQWVHRLAYLPLLLLGVLGFIKLRNRTMELLPLHLILLSFILISWIYWSHTRHAISYHLVWLVAAGYTLHMWTYQNENLVNRKKES